MKKHKGILPHSKLFQVYKELIESPHRYANVVWGSIYSNYETRDCKDLQIPRLITEYAKKGFYSFALRTWNDIPVNIRETQTLGRFKKEIKAHLTS